MLHLAIIFKYPAANILLLRSDNNKVLFLGSRSGAAEDFVLPAFDAASWCNRISCFEMTCCLHIQESAMSGLFDP